MPLISSFYGITIYMYFLAKEHNPSHIHVYYDCYNAIISISSSKIIEGKLPRKTLKLTRVWVNLHREELEIMWNSQVFKRIDPLT